MSAAVIPAPHHVETGQGGYLLREGAAVVVADAALLGEATLFVSDLDADIGIVLRGPSVGDSADGGILIHFDGEGLDAVSAARGVRADGNDTADERYGLAIESRGIHVWANTSEGVHRALTTLRHLAIAGPDLPVLRIIDGPRFAWRGLSLDVVRTFHEVDTVRRVIDMLSLHKLNVLHLHLTDNEGWRFEVPGWPLLTAVGGQGAAAGRPGGHYTPADIADLVAYAADRHVTIVPEVDIPGHTAAAFLAYPRLGLEQPMVIDLGETKMPIVYLDPAREDTWMFVADLLDSLLAQFPQSTYLHLGGDEAFGMPEDAHAAFVERAAEMIRERGRKVSGWQEIARADLDGDELVQYWMEGSSAQNLDVLRAVVPEKLLPAVLENLDKAAGDVPAALAQGAMIIASPTARLYFDRPHAAGSDDPEQDALRPRLGLPVYPAAALRDGVDWDVVAEIPGITEDRIAGIEAAIWCETVTGRDDLELLLLPRLAGAAEKAWALEGATVWDDYAVRLSRQSRAWDRRGWNWYRSSEVEWPALAHSD